MARAKEWGYPLEALRLSMTSYSWKRRLVIDGVVGKGIYFTKGVAAGSPFAPFELALVVPPTIVRLRVNGIPLALSIHVDDFMISATGTGEDQVISRMIEEAAMVYDETSSVGLVVERAKGFVLGSSRRLAARLYEVMGQFGGEAVDSVKRLGVDRWWDPKGRSRPVFAGRFGSGRKRAKRLRGLVKWTEGSGIRAFMAGVAPHATYGSELAAVGKKDLERLREDFVDTCGPRPLGTPRDLQVLGIGIGRDPGFCVRVAPPMGWLQEIWLRTSKVEPAQDVLTSLEYGLVGGRPVRRPQVASWSRRGLFEGYSWHWRIWAGSMSNRTYWPRPMTFEAA